jgi:hypothetical protein
VTLPAFSAVGTGSETAPAWPTHAAGDFGILFVESQAGTIATPTGWTALPACASTTTKLSMFYRFATSAAEGAPSLSGGTDHMWGVILTYTGVNTSTPIHGVSVQPRVTGTAHVIPGTTTFIDDCLIVLAVAWAPDNAGPLSSGETNADLGSLSERYDAGTVTGNGGGLVVLDGTLATHGKVGLTAITFSAGGVIAMACLALQDATKTFTFLNVKSRAVNTGM